MPNKTGLRLVDVARNPANGFPARLLEASAGADISVDLCHAPEFTLTQRLPQRGNVSILEVFHTPVCATAFHQGGLGGHEKNHPCAKTRIFPHCREVGAGSPFLVIHPYYSHLASRSSSRTLASCIASLSRVIIALAQRRTAGLLCWKSPRIGASYVA